MRLAILADTHLPKGARRLPVACVERRFPHAHALVFGHSHLPLHQVGPASGFQLFNPGSPTERRRAPSHTMGLAEVRDGRLRFELVDLDAATRPDPATH